MLCVCLYQWNDQRDSYFVFSTALHVLGEQDRPALYLTMFFQVMVEHRGMTMRKLAFTSANHTPVDKEKSIFFIPSTKVEEERLSLFFFPFFIYVCVCVCACSKANKSLKQSFSNNSFSWQNFLCLLLAEGHCNSCNKGGKDLLVEIVYFKLLFVLPPLRGKNVIFL